MRKVLTSHLLLAGQVYDKVLKCIKSGLPLDTSINMQPSQLSGRASVREYAIMQVEARVMKARASEI